MGGFIVKSKAEDLLLWEQRINERNRSGITVDEWCKKNGSISFLFLTSVKGGIISIKLIYESSKDKF